jgi:RecA/RadA recombinase
MALNALESHFGLPPQPDPEHRSGEDAVEPVVHVVQMLHGHGVHSVERTLMARDEQLIEASAGHWNAAHCELAKSELAQRLAAPMVPLLEFINGSKHVIALSTGVAVLDRLLGGGVRTEEVTELCGSSGTAKTQLCLGVVASVLVESSRARVIFVDTLGNFSPELLAATVACRLPPAPGAGPALAAGAPAAQAAALRDPRVRALLARVRVVKAFDLPSLVAAVSLDHAEQPVRLLVVDSMAGVLAPLMGGRGSMLASSAVARVGRRLKEQALRLRLAVLLTNNVVIDHVGGGHKPALGTTYVSIPSTRVMLQPVPPEQHQPPQPQRVSARLVRSRRCSVTDSAVSFVAPALTLAMPPPPLLPMPTSMPMPPPPLPRSRLAPYS